MKYRHWFWDFDGTLFNTYPRICRAFQKSLADAGIFEDCAVILPQLKITLRTATEYFSSLHEGITAQSLLEGYHLHSEEEDISTFIPYPGMKDFLVSIVASGGNNFLYTHRGNSVFDVLEYNGIKGLFSDILTSLDGFPAKPAPDALLHLMKKHTLNPLECVMAGDREIDLAAGLNAGMNAICLDPDGFCPPIDCIPAFHDYRSLSSYILGIEG